MSERTFNNLMFYAAMGMVFLLLYLLADAQEQRFPDKASWECTELALVDGDPGCNVWRRKSND